MADERYIINLILNARDNTADALRRIARNLRGVEAAQRNIERQNVETARSFRRINEVLDGRTRRLETARRQYRRFSDEAIQAEINLQRAAREYARVQSDANATTAERERATKILTQAQRAYTNALQDSERMERAYVRRSAQRRAARIRQLAEETEYVRNYIRQIKEAEREEERHNKKREESEKALADLKKFLDKEIEKSKRESYRRLQQQDAEEERNRKARRRQEEIWAREDEIRRERELEAPRKYLDLLRQIQKIETDRELAKRQQDYVTVARLDFEDREARRKAQALRDELRLMFRDAEAKIEADIDIEDLRRHAVELLALKETLSRDINIDVDLDVGAAVAKLAAFEVMKKQAAEPGPLEEINMALQRIMRSFDGASQRIATFDNFLRGLAAVGIFAFFNQLILLVGAAVSNLLSLASSASMAGAALGGALAAGLSQALPVIGIFTASLLRLNAVLDAVRQAELLQQQQSYQAPAQNRRIRNSIDSVISAQERLADAHRRVRTAQEELTQARETARRKLEDLILAERGARFSLEDAESAVRRATSIDELNRAFLDRDEAALNLRRTSADLAQRRSAGIAGAPEVLTAQERVRDAQRAVASAERSLRRASEAADAAEQRITAAAGKLNYLLSQLSPAERRLYVALKRLQDEFQETSQIVVEPIINSMIRGFNRLIEVVTSSRVRNAMLGLSEEMARAGDRVTDSLLENRTIDQFIRLTDAARNNLAPITDIIINLGRAFTDLAEAASPAFRSIILWLRDISEEIQSFFEIGRETGRLDAFFRDGVIHLRAWANLLWQIIRLFAAITGVGGGADAGLRLINTLANAIGRFADRIYDADSRTSRYFRQFFEVGQRMLFALFPVIDATAKAFMRLFDEEGVRNVESFAFFLSEILIPALGHFAETVGDVTRFITDLLRRFPILTEIIGSALSMLLTLNVFLRIGTVFRPVVVSIATIFGLLSRRDRLLRGFLPIIARIGAALARLPIVGGLIGGAIATGRIRGGIVAGAAGGLARTSGGVILPPGVSAEAERTGSRLGGRFASGFRRVAFGILRRAGWVGLGVSAVEGIMSAFRYNSIKAGIQDFAHTMSFGLIDSFEESARKRLKEATENLGRVLRDSGVDFRRNVLDIDLERITTERVLRHPSAGARSVPGTWGYAEVNRLREFIDAVRENYGDELADQFDRATTRVRGLIETLRRTASNRDGFLDTFSGQTARTLRTINREIEQLTNLIDITPRGMMRDYLVSLRREAVRTRRVIEQELSLDRINLDFAKEIQKANNRREIGRLVSEYIVELRRFPLGARREAARAIVDTTRVLERMGSVPVGTARELSRRLDNAVTRWTRRAVIRSREAVRDIGRTLNALLAGFSTGASSMVSGVNSILSAFGVRTVRVPVIGRIDVTKAVATIGSVASLFTGRASGGFVGNPGERGQDAVPALLGRGEAVLNWAHQRLIEPALRSFYGVGLQEFFRRTKGLHAGESLGYAGGGFVGPAGTGAGFIPIANFAASRFGLTMTAGRTDHSYYTSSGNVSDHAKGLAGDFSNGSSPTPEMDAFNAFWKYRLPQTVKQLIWRNVDQFRGFPIGGHMDHVHLAVLPAYAFNAGLMARLISRASRGLSVARLLASAGSLLEQGGDQIDHIHRVIIRGAGPLVALANRALLRIQRAANRFIDTRASDNLGNIREGPNDAKQIHLAPGESAIVGASQFGGPSDPGTGTTGYRGDNLALKPDSYAELSTNPEMGVNADFAALGDLPYLTKLRITGPRGSAIAYKRDVGAGGGPVNGYPRAIDLWYVLAQRLGVSGLAPVRVQRLARGGLMRLQQFARGGFVRGRDGEPVPIIAHAGEWVLNAEQQRRLSRLIGLGLEEIKGLLGFPGAAPKTHYQDGGEIVRASRVYTDVEGTGVLTELRKQTREAQEQTKLSRQHLEERRKDRLERARSRYDDRATYSGPALNIAPTTVAETNREIRAVFGAIRTIGTGRAGRREGLTRSIQRFLDNIRWLIGDDGYLRSVTELIDRRSERLLMSIEIARAGLRRVGNLFRRRRPLADETRIAQETIDALQETERDIIRHRRQLVRGLRETNQRLRQFLRRIQASNERELAELRRIENPSERQRDRIRELSRLVRARRIEGRLTDRQLRQYQALRRVHDDFMTALDDNTRRRIDIINQIREQVVARFTSGTERATRGITRRLEDTDRRIQIGQISEISEDELAPLLEIRARRLERQREIIRQRLQRARELAQRNPAMREIVRDLQQQLDALDIEIAQAQRDITDNYIARLERQLNDVFERFDADTQSISTRQAIAQAFGRTGEINNLTQEALNIARQQIDELVAMLPQFADAPELQSQIQERISELNVRVAELTAQLLENAIDAAEREAANRERSLGLRERRLALLERMTGNRLGAILGRQTISAERISGLQYDLAVSRQLLSEAILQGNEEAIQSLTERIAELVVQIEEENATRQELVYQYRQAAIALITGSADRSTGLLGSARELLQRISDIAGSSMAQTLLRLARQTTDILRREAEGIIGAVNEAIFGGEFGAEGTNILMQLVAAFAAGPESFAAKLAELAPAIAELESTLGVEALRAFQDLINAMIRNTGALLDNTREINELTGASTTPQTWSTSAWQWFRQAIFDGMGQVLPQYEVPQLSAFNASGGTSAISPNSQFATYNSNEANNQAYFNIEINEAGQPVDVTHLTNRLAFAYKSWR